MSRHRFVLLPISAGLPHKPTMDLPLLQEDERVKFSLTPF